MMDQLELAVAEVFSQKGLLMTDMMAANDVSCGSVQDMELMMEHGISETSISEEA